MRLVSYRHDDAPGVGVMVDDTGFVALDNAAPDLPSSLRRIIAMEDGLSRAAAAADGKAADLTFDDVELETGHHRSQCRLGAGAEFSEPYRRDGPDHVAGLPPYFSASRQIPCRTPAAAAGAAAGCGSGLRLRG